MYTKFYQSFIKKRWHAKIIEDLYQVFLVLIGIIPLSITDNPRAKICKTNNNNIVLTNLRYCTHFKNSIKFSK